MARKSTFIPEGGFYKGNTHCHSLFSDGRLSVRQLKDAYKGRGYQFHVFSDHDIYSNWNELNDDSFCVIQGFEGKLILNENKWHEWHFVIIPGSKTARLAAKKPFFKHMEKVPMIPFTGLDSVRQYIDEMAERGYSVILCHPHWSTIEYDEVLQLKGLIGCEVYNYCSDILENMGESNVFWDACMRRGMKLWATAADDNHNGYGLDSVYCDSFGGFIQVKARALTEEDICESIACGSFYASQGPEIYDFYIEEGIAHFTCSPVKKIYINGHIRQIGVALAEEDRYLTSFAGKLQGSEIYVRIECYDEKGKKAYTNPIYL